MTPLRLMLDYVMPWPNAAGFYVARDRGWYREVGLEVAISTHEYARGDTLAYLDRTEVTFGVFPSNRLLVRRAHHAALIGVAAINHTGLETLQGRADRGITRPRDLAGATIAYGPTPRGRAMVNHLIAADGGDPSAVVTIDSGTRELTPEFLLECGADGMFGGYWCWDVLTRDPAAEHLLTWPVAEIGAPKYHSYLLGTQESTVLANPEMVRTFLHATGRGFEAAATDQEAAIDVLAREIPYAPRWKLAESLRLVAPTWFHAGRWGIQREEELIAPYAAWLAARGALPEADAWIGATTNGLLPAAPQEAV